MDHYTFKCTIIIHDCLYIIFLIKFILHVKYVFLISAYLHHKMVMSIICRFEISLLCKN